MSGVGEGTPQALPGMSLGAFVIFLNLRLKYVQVTAFCQVEDSLVSSSALIILLDRSSFFHWFG